MRLARLHVFAVNFQAKAFEFAVLIRFQQFIASRHKQENVKAIPSLDVMAYLLENTTSVDSGLCSFLTDLYVHYGEVIRDCNIELDFSPLKSQFLVKVIDGLYKRISNIYEKTAPDLELCKYHGHESNETRKECRKRFKMSIRNSGFH